MKVVINPTKQQKGSGTTGWSSWHNADTRLALEKMFGVDPKREQITQIEIDKNGITVRLENV